MSKLDELIKEYCPDGVEYRRISEIAEVGTGSSDRKNAVDDGKYPFYVRSKEVLKSDRYLFDETAVVIPGEGGVGDIFHYVEGKYDLHQRAYRIHFIDKSVDSKYAYYYFCNSFKPFIMMKSVAATVTSIRKPMIEGFVIPVPPLEVQREIVRVLDNFTCLTAELTAELQLRKKQYEYYRDQMLTFGRIDGASAQRIKLGDIATFTYGYTDKAKDQGDTRFIRITDILDTGVLNPVDAKYITLSDESRKYLLKTGDLLMARTGATYGKTLYVPDDLPAVYASFLIKINLDNDVILNRYYWHFAQSNLYWEQANRLVSTGGQPQFNTGAVSRVIVPVPPIDVQERIVEVLDNFDAICSDLNIGLPAEIDARQKQYEYYRDLLLTFAEKGETIFTDRQTDRQTDRT